MAHFAGAAMTIPGIGSCLAVFILGIALTTTVAEASGGPKPDITLRVSPKRVATSDGLVTISATVANAMNCTLKSSPKVPGLPVVAFDCEGGNVSDTTVLPSNSGMKYKFTLEAEGGKHNTKSVEVSVPSGAGGNPLHLSNVSEVVSGGGNSHGQNGGSCALLTSGGVECWGDGELGQLGNGIFYSAAPAMGSAIPVQVEAVGGSGTLTGVSSLSGDLDGYCALLTSAGVDCWGGNEFDDLGNGTSTESATPVAVAGGGSSGTLTGVAKLVTDGAGYCAVLTSGGVDCWGEGVEGELGDGASTESATPVAVAGVGGSGTLTGVASVSSNIFGDSNYCALLTSGGVDCWGFGSDGELGNGTFTYAANTPVAVEAVGGSGTLTGVAGLSNDGSGYCALLTSGAVDCWGGGEAGQLGNGTFYTTGNKGSATPVAVAGVGGSGTLTDVASVSGDLGDYCALLSSGGVDCWGGGDLGDGTSNESATPVAVEGVGGSGTLTAVASMPSDSQCAVLTSGGVDCWGDTPVAVEGVGGSGTLTDV